MGGRSSQYRFSLILVATIASCLLLALSWPRLRASMHYLPVDTAISNYWNTLEFDYSQLDGLIERAGQSIALHDHYRYWEGLSELHILGGQDMSRPFWVRRQALEESISAAQQAVWRAPAKPRTWLRIARAKEFLAYPADQIIPALKMSILTGRVEPTLMLTRLELGLRQLSAMDRESVFLIRDQAVLSWTTQQGTMLNRIESGTLSLDLLREVLTPGNPAIISEMEAHFVE